ncbi:PHP domain-containing protein [Rhodococcus sp. G-MC3]|uniref:PHP domain-containing protein n=1 Tax=Rhodococcus sp. G-MC3 TaxID=3046209 RepID=UPI0024BBE1B4|nr:PHP domain-containing protein [Rhodococcus sp. G-MC3]MDJ0392363.1 PHP domain-containing protein [Rhodococcus sp. G-MC3]
MLIDLHTHSSVSDGTDTPAELVRAARETGLDVVAITDHDTTAGWDEAVSAAPAGLTVVRGMEMSCVGRGVDGNPVPVHLLAYLFDPKDEVFAQELERLRGERTGRIRVMAELLAVDHPEIVPDEILAATGESAGRPHLARALVDIGAVRSVQEAFDGYLSTKSPYYVAKIDTPLERAVEMIKTAGGVSVLAHARARTRGRLLDPDHIRELAAHGLGGVEVEHADHDAADTLFMRELAVELDLIATGSSDYHGSNKLLKLGEHTTAVAQYERLLDEASGVPA